MPRGAVVLREDDFAVAVVPGACGLRLLVFPPAALMAGICGKFHLVVQILLFYEYTVSKIHFLIVDKHAGRTKREQD